MVYNPADDLDESMQIYFNDLSPFKSLTKEEEHKLLKKYKNKHDIEARNTLIRSNLKYACSIASKYRGRGISFSDLVAEANDALIDSIDRFDIKQDVKIFSYAKWWMMQRMQSVLKEKGKMPISELPTETETPFDDNEDAIVQNDSVSDSFIDYGNNDDCDDEKIFLRKIFNILSEREQDMVNMYYGRFYEKEYTLEEIGKKYNLTKERVRQIIENAFTKIRSEAMLVENKYLSR